MATYAFDATRNVRLYPFLWSAAGRALEQARKESDPRHFCLTSMVCTAFSLEAFLNYALQHKFEHWEGLEFLQPRAKLELLSYVAGYRPEMGKQPFQSFTEIIRFRNQVAHPKPFSHSYKGTVELGSTQGIEALAPGPAPEKGWEAMLTVRVAQRFLTDSMAMIDDLSREVLGEEPDWSDQDTSWWMSPVPGAAGSA